MRDGCRGKLRHPSREMADAHAEELRRSGKDHPTRAARITSYPCRTCGSWHVGHSRPLRRLLRSA